jgi:two-component sensor histidine kinase
VDRFSAANLALLEPLAITAAVAIENARLYEQARQDAETKTLLLQEVNHRVNNNLAAIIGMLYIEQRHTEQSQDRRTYQDIMGNLINRIEGLATVHQLLSASRWSPLSLSELARQVIGSVLQTLPPEQRVFTDIPPASVRVTPKQANNLAIVINELATNVVKHALRERQTAQITVHIAQDDETILLEFRDDGPGFSKEVLHLERQSVGMYLIQNTVRQNLHGEITLHNDNGAVVTIRLVEAVEIARS